MGKSKKNGKSVLIIDGASRQCLPMIKGFNKLGFTVYVYCSSKLDLGYKYKYTDKRLLVSDLSNDAGVTFSNIQNILQTNSIDLVIPMNDYFATVLSKNKQELSKISNIYVNDWNVFSNAIDKLQTMKICMDNDIGCPKTAIFNSINDFDDKDWNYPLVIKPRSSFGAKGFSTVNTREELVERFGLTEEKFGPTLVQEYIPQDGKQYQVELLIDCSGNCAFFVLMEKNRWYPINGGSSTLNTTIHDEKIKEMCLKLMKKINWRGYATLDVIEDTRTNEPKIMEINPRINGTVKICFFAGYDVADFIWRDSLEQTIECQQDYKDGLRLRYFHMDVLWFLKSKSRWKCKPSWFSNKNTVDEIFSWEDLRPALRYIVVCFRKLRSDKKNRGVDAKK